MTGEGSHAWTFGEGLKDQKANDAVKVDCSQDLTPEDIEKQKTSGTQWEKDFWGVVLPVKITADTQRQAELDEVKTAEPVQTSF